MKLFKYLLLVFIFTATTATTATTDLYEFEDPPEWKTMVEAQQLAAEDNKLIFIFVEAEWCGLCKQMKKNVFPDNNINKLLSDKFHLVSIDLDSKREITFNDEKMTEREFARKMGVMATPTMIFIDPKGEEMGRRPGFMNAELFNKLLLYVNSDQFTEVSFDEFSAEG